MTKKIREFQGMYRFLSNFHPCKIVVDTFMFSSVEHAYQAQKCKRSDWYLFADVTPGRAKRLGRDLRVREDWDRVKLGIMRDLLDKKFAHAELSKMLLDTGDAELIEGNTWGDVYWGVCNGEGKNKLGRLLMEVREALKE